MFPRSLLVALLLLAADPAVARVSPNPEGRALIDPDGAVLRPGRPRVDGAHADGGARTEAATVNVPLPAGAVQLDSTWYDLQDMGSLGTRIVAGVDGRVHVTYQKDFCENAGGCPPNQNAPQPYPQRGMAYTMRDAGGAWARRGKVADPDIRNCCLTELFGGFGTLALAPSGRVAISQHMNEEGCDLRGNFYLQDAVDGPSYTAYLTPIAPTSYLFPQVAATTGGSFVVLGEIPKGGEYDEVQEFRVSRVASAGATFVCPTGWQGGPWTSIVASSLFRGNQPAFPTIAAANDGRVGVAVTDFGGNAFLIESSNGTFNAGTITVRTLTSYSDAAITAPDSTSTQYRAYVNCHLAYNDTTPHVVWSELQARRVGGQIQYFDWRSRIRHWSPGRGVTTVKQVQAGEADRFDDVDRGLSGPLCGFNTLTVDWPQVGFSTDGGEIYVAWLRASDSEVDPTANYGLPGIVTGVAFMDIAASVTRASDPWSSPAQNLTSTPTTDERFFSLSSRNADGKAHVLFQASATNEAGCAIIGDRGTTPVNLLRRIAYLERPLAGSTVDVADGTYGTSSASPSLHAWPNPARGRVSFRSPSAAPGAAVEIYAVTGRLVARVPLRAPGQAEWDGLDLRGRAAPTGVYLARVTGAPPEMASKFLLIH